MAEPDDLEGLDDLEALEALEALAVLEVLENIENLENLEKITLITKNMTKYLHISKIFRNFAGKSAECADSPRTKSQAKS